MKAQLASHKQRALQNREKPQFVSISLRNLSWIRPLAIPYLRGYRAIAERGGSLRGFWFLHPGSRVPAPSKPTKLGQMIECRRAPALGFFIGCLLSEAGFGFSSPQLPECLTFVGIYPLGGDLHRRLVVEPESLVRRTFTYIRWLTHRPPRFEFYETGPAAMARRQTMREWPAGRCEHFARNFYVETLAWLVRSGLVRGLLAEELSVPPGARSQKEAGRRFLRVERAKY